MARSYRSRRFRSARRIGRRYGAKKSSMARIKKDIMKCNFPTKVKFMGLTERKVMFLTKNLQVAINRPEGEDPAQDPGTGRTRSFYLCPLNTDNIKTIMKVGPDSGNPAANALFSNWDKFCILGIYIKFQPIINMFDGGNASKFIHPVTATYTMNNVILGKTAAYDQTNKDNKQVFTFNSNEAFTVYVPAPTTMETSSAVVHKSKTWWSLTDLVKFANDIEDVREENDNCDDDDCSSDCEQLGNPYQPVNVMHGGRISLDVADGGQVNYNVTINYKIALKG